MKMGTVITTGITLTFAGLVGLMYYGVQRNSSQLEESQKSVAKHFQTASAEDRLESIRRGMVYFQCHDKATGLPYEIENLEKEDVTDEGLKVSGCEVTSSVVGGKSILLAPAQAL